MAELEKGKPAQRLVAAEGHSGAESPAICGKAPFRTAGRGGFCERRLGSAGALAARGAADSRARGKGRHNAGPNANGAGIAADPTLTSAWTPLARDASGEPSASFAPGYAWRPMSSLSLPCLAASLARDLSPALAPASGFCSCPAAPFRSPKSPMFAALHSRLAETVSLSRSGLAAGPDLRLSPSPDPARFAASPVALASLPLHQADLHSAEASCMPSLGRRVDSCHRHPWD